MTAKITLITVTLLLLRCCTNLQYLEMQFLTFVCLSVFSPNSDKIHGSSLIQTNIPHLETNSISIQYSCIMIQDIFIFTQYNLTMLQLYLEDPGVYPAADDVQARAGVLGP